MSKKIVWSPVSQGRVICGTSRDFEHLQEAVHQCALSPVTLNGLKHLDTVRAMALAAQGSNYPFEAILAALQKHGDIQLWTES